MAGSSRILFRSLHVYREARRAETQVELWNGAQALIGTAQGLAVHGGLPTLVAQATLEALRGAIDPHLDVDLVAVERKRMGHRSLMLTHLVVLEGREERHLSGSVLITSDALEATVFSVLDALNRILDFGALEVVPEHRPVDGIHDELERKGSSTEAGSADEPSLSGRRHASFSSMGASRRSAGPPVFQSVRSAEGGSRIRGSRPGPSGAIEKGGTETSRESEGEAANGTDIDESPWEEFEVDSIVPRGEDDS